MISKTPGMEPMVSWYLYYTNISTMCGMVLHNIVFNKIFVLAHYLLVHQIIDTWKEHITVHVLGEGTFMLIYIAMGCQSNPKKVL